MCSRASSIRTRTSTCRSAARSRPTISPAARARRARRHDDDRRLRAAHERRLARTTRSRRGTQRPPAKRAVDYAFHLTIADGRDETMNEIPKIINEQGVNSFKVFMAYKHVLHVDDETIFKTLQACREARRPGAGARRERRRDRGHHEGGARGRQDRADVARAHASGGTRRRSDPPRDSAGRGCGRPALRRARVERDGRRRDQRRTQTRAADLRRDLPAVSGLRHRGLFAARISPARTT